MQGTDIRVWGWSSNSGAAFSREIVLAAWDHTPHIMAVKMAVLPTALQMSHATCCFSLPAGPPHRPPISQSLCQFYKPATMNWTTREDNHRHKSGSAVNT
jgi:hypothetical protein